MVDVSIVPETDIIPEEYDDEPCTLVCELTAGLLGSVFLDCKVLYGKVATLEMMFIRLDGLLSWRQVRHKYDTKLTYCS